ncbi:MAG TPA: AraC family transcriptional regulator ligand-binding domain-containing protein [Moraxellaceae bacterium]|nr:AraC family transcriptional regulator ligand-binding domain-containing protein [Moraxellaceae bacterium]
MASFIRVTGAWVGLLLDWLDQEHLPATELRAAIQRWAQEDIVPLPVWRDLLMRTVALRPEAGTPLAIGALVKPRHVGVLGYLVLASKTLAEALQAYQRYERLFYGANLAEVVIDGAEVEIRWPPHELLPASLHDIVAIAALVTFMNQQVASPPPPTRVVFTLPPPPPAEQAVYEAFFECPVAFGEPQTRVRIPLAYLALPMLHSDPGLRLLLDQQAQALVAAMPDADAFDRSLQQTLLSLLPEGGASVARVAEALHVSVRTLQRRLDGRGVTWQQVLDRSREELARHYLADRALTLSEIALLLGFSEQSAFTRAFRRWTGETPVQVRKRLRSAS